jgi:carbon storage regulator
MLVLGRDEDEAILIGDDIRIVVCSIRGNRVRLGIMAPDGVVIDREEVRRRKDRERPKVAKS